MYNQPFDISKSVKIDGLSPEEYYKDKDIPYDRLISIYQESGTARVGCSAYLNPYYKPEEHLKSKGWEVTGVIPGTGSSLFFIKKV